MPILGKTSLERLNGCHLDLQKIVKLAITIYDFSVACGQRNKADQDKANTEGKSKLKWPEGKHNKTPSEAVDLYPCPFDGSNNAENINRFYFLAGVMFAAWKFLYNNGEITSKLRWGSDWNSNMVFTDESFMDLPHFEIIK